MISKEELIRRLGAGQKVSEIAKELNYGEKTIYRAINKYDLKKEEPLYKNPEWLLKELQTKEIQDIAKEQNVATHTISRWMKRYNITKPNPLYQDKKWLEEQAKIFNTIKELSDHFGFVEYTVRDWCRKHNVKFNNSNNSDFIENYFKEIDTERKAYYLGLLMADGFMKKNLSIYGIGLKVEDTYMIENLLRDINYKTAIYEKVSEFGALASYVDICSKKMCTDLIYHGIVPKKSGKECFPTYSIPNKLQKHFIRGFMDGDGWITNSTSSDKKYYQLEVGMCSMSINILYGIQQYLKNTLNIDTNITKRSDKELFYLKIYSSSAKMFLDHIYEESTIFLTRKKNKYDNVQLGPVNKNV